MDSRNILHGFTKTKRNEVIRVISSRTKMMCEIDFSTGVSKGTMQECQKVNAFFSNNLRHFHLFAFALQH